MIPTKTTPKIQALAKKNTLGMLPRLIVHYGVFCAILMLGITTFLDAQVSECMELSYQHSIEIAIENDPGVQNAGLAMEEERLSIEEQFANRRQTRVYELQRRVMELAAENAIKDRKQDVTRNVIEQYNQYLIVQKQVQLAEQNVSVAQFTLETTQDSLHSGVISQRELGQAQETLEIRQQELREKKQWLHQAKVSLTLTLNLPLDQCIRLTDTLEPVEFPASIETNLPLLAHKNRTLNRLALQVELNQALHEVQANNRVQAEHEIQRAELAYQKSQMQYQQTLRELKNLFIVRYSTCQTKYESIRTRYMQYTFAHDNYERVRAEREAGISTEQTLLQTGLQMLSNQVLYFSTISEYNLAVWDYEQMLND